MHAQAELTRASSACAAAEAAALAAVAERERLRTQLDALEAAHAAVRRAQLSVHSVGDACVRATVLVVVC